MSVFHLLNAQDSANSTLNSAKLSTIATYSTVNKSFNHFRTLLTHSITGTSNDSQISICSVGFDDHYFSHSGFFGAGAVRDVLCNPLPCRTAYV
jgi:hypothetical protein